MRGAPLGRGERPTRWLSSCATGIAALLIAFDAGAQSPPEAPDAMMVELYRQGRALLAEGRWAEACPKFEAVRATKETAAVLINVGDCHAHDGKLVKAYDDYLRARVLNRETQPAARQTELEEEIRQRLQQIGPRVPRINIQMERPIPGVVIRQDGREIHAGALGADLPVDVGSHEVTAEAPGFSPQKYTVVVQERETRSVVVRLTAAEEPFAARHTGSLVMGSLAVAFGGVTAGLGAWTVSSHPDIVKRCAEGPQQCKDEAAGLEARGIATNLFLGLACASAVTAGVLFFAVERPKTPKAEVAISGTGAVVRVRW